MKKSIIIICGVIVVFGVTAFTFINFNNTAPITKVKPISFNIPNSDVLKNIIPKPEAEILYEINSRFIATVSKETVINANSIIDILPKSAINDIVSYQDVKVAILDKNDLDELDNELGYGDQLNPLQKKLLQKTDHTSTIYIKAIYKYKGPNGELFDDYLTYYVSVVPEYDAKYESGYQTVIDYLKENTKELVSEIEPETLKACRIRFIIDKNGHITNASIDSTSGYPSIDKVLVKLISDMPKKWNPARNSVGLAVEQEFFFFFGMKGC